MTNSFQAEDVIGEGGFGVVYRGALPDGSTVAVKRACREAMRSSREFRTEVKLLSRLHHQVRTFLARVTVNFCSFRRFCLQFGLISLFVIF